LEATGWAQEILAFLDATVQLLHVRGVVCRCTVMLEHKVVTRHSTYRCQQYEAISKKPVRDITRISGFVTTMKLPHALQILTVFCEEVYVVAFFKVVQQQIIVEVGNSLTCLWVDNFCLQQ